NAKQLVSNTFYTLVFFDFVPLRIYLIDNATYTHPVSGNKVLFINNLYHTNVSPILKIEETRDLYS
ncbi:MAG: hypothetical protein ACK5JU_09400, partial [Bacteroidales bacterium]